MTTRQGFLRLFISLAAIAAAALGIGGEIAYARLGDVAGQAVFLSPWFSAVLVLCGAALFAARTSPRHARWWALLALGAIVLARLGAHGSDAWVNGRIASANMATVLIAVGAVAALAWGRNRQLSRYRVPRGEVIVAILGVAASTLVSFALIEQSILARQDFAAISAQAIAGAGIGHGAAADLAWAGPRTDVYSRTEGWAEFAWLAGIVLTFLLIASHRLTVVARQRALQLSHNALHDPLTGLPNRRMLEQELRRACVKARRSGRLVSLAFFDLDGIKLINDSIGHDVGDQVLIEVAGRLRGGARQNAGVMQLGNVEFVLLFVGADEIQVGERVQAIVEDVRRPYHIAGRVLSMAASVGIVHSDGGVEDPMELLRRADLAMLRAKQAGPNTLYTYTDDLSIEVAERLEFSHDLRIALDGRALHVHYQPIVEGRSGRVTGVETLLRWRHDTHGSVSPARFIPLAEETGLIVPLTDWVLAEACRDSGLLRKQGLPPFAVAVNISALYFLHAGFVETIRRTLDEANLPARFLELEITESVLLENEEAAILKLRQLREMGIRISLDDFGTGYSSLSYLKNLPIDKVKIDRSFVAEVVTDPADAAIAQGIISMAHHLGLRVVAEGVENEPQFSFLRRNHCDAFQGHLFARPMPFDELVDTLSRNECRLLPADPVSDSPEERVLLLVDDEKNILTALTRVLRRDGYRILTARGPTEALELLAKHKVQVIVSDQRMAEMSGTELFAKIKLMYPNTVRMILSGYTDLKSVTEAINHGAIYKFITKPWDDAALRKDIEDAFKNAASMSD